MKILTLTQEVLGHKLLDWESLPGRYYSLLPLFFHLSYSIYCRSIPQEGHWTVVLVCSSGLKASPNSEQWWACWPTFKHYPWWSQQCQVLSLDLALALPHPKWLWLLEHNFWMWWCPSPPPFIIFCALLAETLGIQLALITFMFFLELSEIGFFPAWMSCCYFYGVSSTIDTLGSQDLVCLVAQAYKDSIPHA